MLHQQLSMHRSILTKHEYTEIVLAMNDNPRAVNIYIPIGLVEVVKPLPPLPAKRRPHQLCELIKVVRIMRKVDFQSS